MARSGAPVRIDAKRNDALQNPRLSQAFSPHVRVNAGPADDERRIQSAAGKNDLRPEASVAIPSLVRAITETRRVLHR